MGNSDADGSPLAPGPLLAIVEQKLQIGSLPRTDPVDLKTGSGSGRACAACEASVASDQTQIEVEFVVESRDDSEFESFSLPFHVECYTVWDTLR